jgi:hypothetical protein
MDFCSLTELSPGVVKHGEAFPKCSGMLFAAGQVPMGKPSLYFVTVKLPRVDDPREGILAATHVLDALYGLAEMFRNAAILLCRRCEQRGDRCFDLLHSERLIQKSSIRCDAVVPGDATNARGLRREWPHGCLGKSTKIQRTK